MMLCRNIQHIKRIPQSLTNYHYSSNQRIISLYQQQQTRNITTIIDRHLCKHISAYKQLYNNKSVSFNTVLLSRYASTTTTASSNTNNNNVADTATQGTTNSNIWSVGDNNSFNVSPENYSKTAEIITNNTDTINAASTMMVDERWPITKAMSEPVEQLITLVHNTTGLPWWCTIILTTVTIRTLLFPLFVTQSRTSANAQLMKPEMDVVIAEMKNKQRSNAHGLTPQDRLDYSNRIRGLYAKHKVRFSRMFIGPIILAPTFFTFFTALRHLPLTQHESLQTGGTLWFTDLTVPDPYFALGIISGFTSALAVKYGSEIPNMGDDGDTIKNSMAVFIVITSLVVGYMFPSSVMVYWVTNNLCTLITGRIVGNKAVKRYFKIPALPASKPQPISEMFKKLVPKQLQSPESQKPQEVVLYSRKPIKHEQNNNKIVDGSIKKYHTLSNIHTYNNMLHTRKYSYVSRMVR